jgi:hypothetical protein
LNPGNYNNAEDYIKDNHRYHIPLSAFFCKGSPDVDISNWIDSTLELNIVSNNEFEWPTAVAYCMPSVQSSFQRHVSYPRLSSSEDTDMIQKVNRFIESSGSFYDDISKMTNVNLVKSLRRKVTCKGEEEKFSGLIKKSLESRIKQCTRSYILNLYRPLEQESVHFVLDLLSKQFRSEDQKYQIVATFSDFRKVEHELTLLDIQQFSIRTPIEEKVFNYFMNLYSHQDEMICISHTDVNQNKQHYQQRKFSKFVSCSFIKYILNNVDLSIENFQNDFELILLGDISKLWKIYVPIPPNILKNYWSLFVIDVESSMIVYYDPTNSSDEILVDAHTLSLLKRFLSVALPNSNIDDWHLKTDTPFETDLTNKNSAIYVMLYIMLTHNEVPKGFNSEDADRLRLGICFNLLRGVIA